jgi:HPt (histidine-containing phosphotransfer) domain-containing protein
VRSLLYEKLAKQTIEITESIQNLDYADLIKVSHIIKGSAGSFDYDDSFLLTQIAYLFQ